MIDIVFNGIRNRFGSEWNKETAKLLLGTDVLQRVKK